MTWEEELTLLTGYLQNTVFCQMALCDAVPALERALTTLSYLAGECRDDLKKYCSDVKVGRGRLINCLDKKKDVLTNRCKTAFDEIVVK
ncbi:MAG: cysteine rich repeat-containing protein [Syntrophales bacterium]